MATIREQKEAVVAEIAKLIDESKSMVIVKYQGINTEEDTALRKQLRENGVQYKVLKNTMVNLAMKDRNAEGIESYLAGPNAFAFGQDEVTAAKLIKSFIKDKKKLEIMGGYVDGQLFNADQVMALADMPSKEEMIAKLMGSLNAPISNFVGVLSNLNPAKRFMFMAKALADKKTAEGEA